MLASHNERNEFKEALILISLRSKPNERIMLAFNLKPVKFAVYESNVCAPAPAKDRHFLYNCGRLILLAKTLDQNRTNIMVE